MNEQVYKGSCGCGAIEFSAAERLGDPCYCHCQSCRDASGAPFLAWVSFSLDGFSIDRGELKVRQSSTNVERGFCGDCGCTLTYRNTEHTGAIDVTTCALDPNDQVAPVAHIWVSDKLPWVELSDALPVFAGWREP